MKSIKRLLKDRRGAVAFTFALFVPVLIGAGALAVDMANYRYVDNRLQTAADAGALAGVKLLDNPNAAIAEAVNLADRNVPDSFGNITTTQDVTIGIYDPDTRQFTPSNGADVNAMRVVSARTPERGNVTPQILSMIWGPDDVSISKTAIAARQLKVQYEPPETKNLDPAAWDYNRIYAYCYNYESTSGTPASRRSKITLIADNVPTSGSGLSNFWTEAGKRGFGKVPATLVWPVCEKGESLSIRLENIREVKEVISNTTTTKARWTTYDTNKATKYFNHYTDTIITDGVEAFPGLSEPLVETVRCDSLAACNSTPKHTKGKPLRSAGVPCLPGKYMYFGWEDRPPSSGSDEDYDDIRIVMKCPRTGVLGDGMSRLVA